MNLDEVLQDKPFLPYIREGDYAVRDPWYMPERRLLDYLLVYVQEGRCLFEIDGEAVDLHPGDFVLAQPNAVKTMRGITKTVTPFLHFDIFYHPRRQESFPTRAGQVELGPYLALMQPRLNDLPSLNIPAKLKPKDPQRLADLLLQTLAKWHDPHPLSQMEAQTLLSDIVVRILSDHSPIRQEDPAGPLALRWLPSYLSLHLADPLSVKDMAQRAHLSLSRFREVFKQHYGLPPHRYLLQLRIKHAQDLLASSPYSISRIAQYCGFADNRHFTKAFRQTIGCTPGQYRRNKREVDESDIARGVHIV